MTKSEPVYALKSDLDMLINVVAESKNKFNTHTDWTVGAVETLRIELTVLGAQLDRLTERVEGLEKRVMARFDMQDEKIAKIMAHLGIQDEKIGKIMARLGVQDGKIDAQNTKIDKIMAHLGIQDEKIGKIMVHLGIQDGKIDAQSTKIDKIMAHLGIQ